MLGVRDLNTRPLAFQGALASATSPCNTSKTGHATAQSPFAGALASAGLPPQHSASAKKKKTRSASKRKTPQSKAKKKEQTENVDPRAKRSLLFEGATASASSSAAPSPAPSRSTSRRNSTVTSAAAAHASASAAAMEVKRLQQTLQSALVDVSTQKSLSTTILAGVAELEQALDVDAGSSAITAASQPLIIRKRLEHLSSHVRAMVTEKRDMLLELQQKRYDFEFLKIELMRSQQQHQIASQTAAPQWEVRSTCSSCASRFVFLWRQRHHCRNCGHSICTPCSVPKEHFVPIPRLGFATPVRVCLGCETKLAHAQSMGSPAAFQSMTAEPLACSPFSERPRSDDNARMAAAPGASPMTRYSELLKRDYVAKHSDQLEREREARIVPVTRILRRGFGHSRDESLP